MSEPLPCPFCGSRPLIETEKTTFAIMCLNADCGEVMSRWFMSRDEAVKAWNTRVPALRGDVWLASAVKRLQAFVAWAEADDDSKTPGIVPDDIDRVLRALLAGTPVAEPLLEETDLDCEYDGDGSYAMVWKNGYAITAFPNGRVCITKSPRDPNVPPIGCDVSQLIVSPDTSA